jgi:hypothetical protein
MDALPFFIQIRKSDITVCNRSKCRVALTSIPRNELADRKPVALLLKPCVFYLVCARFPVWYDSQ